MIAAWYPAGHLMYAVHPAGRQWPAMFKQLISFSGCMGTGSGVDCIDKGRFLPGTADD